MAVTDYCTEANIEGWFPGVDFSANTKLTAAKVAEFITGNSAYIDGRIAAKYTVPITGTASLLVVKKICEYLTIAECNAVLLAGLGDRGEGNYPIDYNKRALEMLDRIESGELDLPDATAASSDDFYSDNYENDREFTMKKGTRQW